MQSLYYLMKFHRWSAFLLPLVALLVHLPVKAGASPETLRMTMTITAEVFQRACSIRPGDENIDVDFGTVVSKMLLLHDRTVGQPFQIHLEECSVDLIDTVKVTFSGQEESENRALLGLTYNSQAKGIAIGLEQGGKLLPINKPSNAVTLGEGNNVLEFSAYIQLLPSAKDSITVGSFNASANFMLEYN